MPKCERCGLNGDSLELKVCPDKIPDWGNKPICKRCYLELKKIENNKNIKEKSKLQLFSDNNYLKKKDNKRSIMIYVLVILWLVIGMLFIGAVFQRSSVYFENIGAYSRHMGSIFIDYTTFYYVVFLVLFIIIIIFSFLLAIYTFFKKSQSWLMGLMFSSFLLYFGFQAIYLIGLLIITEKSDQFFKSFEYIVYMCILFLAPFIIFILTRPNVKAYFGKT